MLLHCDNQSTICLAESPVFHARTKHVEGHYYLLAKKEATRKIDKYGRDKDIIPSYRHVYQGAPDVNVRRILQIAWHDFLGSTQGDLVLKGSVKVNNDSPFF